MIHSRSLHKHAAEYTAPSPEKPVTIEEAQQPPLPDHKSTNIYNKWQVGRTEKICMYFWSSQVAAEAATRYQAGGEGTDSEGAASEAADGSAQEPAVGAA